MSQVVHVLQETYALIILMNWICLPLQVWGGFAPPAKNWLVRGAAPPSQNRLFFLNENAKKQNL